jgi:hypothetical protein
MQRPETGLGRYLHDNPLGCPRAFGGVRQGDSRRRRTERVWETL